MRQLSLQEVEVVSGAAGTDTTVVDFTVNDVLKWGAAYFGSTSAFKAASASQLVESYPLAIPYFGVSASQWGLGGLGGLAGGIAGYAAGHFLGQLFNSQVAARVGG